MKDCLRKSFGETCQSFCAEEPTRFMDILYTALICLCWESVSMVDKDLWCSSKDDIGRSFHVALV